MNLSFINSIIKSRASLIDDRKLGYKKEEEGGCGVIGFASTKKVEGKHLLKSLNQMRNRGNGKGGGVAILGLDSEYLNVSEDILKSHFILQIAYLDESIRSELESKYIFSNFEVSTHYKFDNIDDYQSINLEIKPPSVYLYFCRVSKSRLADFKSQFSLQGSSDQIEEEFIFQNSFTINREYYASLGEKRAFVLSHAKNLLVFKLVGYGNQVIQYYRLENLQAHIWIGHHRYPTKGTVWHPGGAHPFIGMNEALVHNGDFSNYHSVSEYLAQRNIYPLFLTDTEIAVYLFDLYSRIYEYPTEYIIEAIAPTTERDYYMLDRSKQAIYRDIQHNHLHGSPDGPWFFIIGRSLYQQNIVQLLGITDTSMLRPQVFALQTGKNDIALVGSEKQAIDAILLSLSESDESYHSKADVYWNARGGSYTDGGAFIFNVLLDSEPKLIVQDKFGKNIEIKQPQDQEDLSEFSEKYNGNSYLKKGSENNITFYDRVLNLKEGISHLSIEEKFDLVQELTYLLDNNHLIPSMKSGSSNHIVHTILYELFRTFPNPSTEDSFAVLLNSDNISQLTHPIGKQHYLLVDINNFEVEGVNSAARVIVRAYELGWKHIYTFDWRGQRYCGCGLGSNSHGFRIDVYGTPGDYLGSGLDGAEIYVHGSTQDQVGQMMKSGKLVIYGDVGQAFLYGAKGGDIFVRGNTAGRPLINAVGRPKVVINGTSLDYLAESFMAGDPLIDGGFAILFGLRFNENGTIETLETPYPGGNLMSLGSGGAIFIYDPNIKIEENQLHGGQIVELTNGDQDLISKYLAKNMELFSIPFMSELGSFRKIVPIRATSVLH